MKNKSLLMITAFLLFLTSSAAFAKEAKPEFVNSPQTELRIQQIEQRVREIKTMDKSRLTGTERKALRQELVSMKKEAKAMTSGGVYLSVGAIIIIILVLLLVL